MTVRRHVAYWVAMSPARRVVASVLVAAAIGGTTFAACRASDVTGPNFKSRQQAGISRSLLSGGDVVGTSDGLTSDNSDSWPMQPASSKKMTPEEAENDETFRTTPETTFPVSEAVYNPCRQELVVLNGFLRRRMRVDADPMLRFQLREFQNTQGVSGSATYDDDGDPTTEPKVVRYNNKEGLIDNFAVGPAQAPMRSEFLSRMHLQREGQDPANQVKQLGDDLFVFVHEVLKIDDKGQTVAQTQFRAECQ
jgi:hypothetical protein